MQTAGMDSQSVAVLMDDLVDDPWRLSNGFSLEVQACNDVLFSAVSDDERGRHLSTWLAEHQPCLFGKMASKKDGLAFCFLTDDDLSGPDISIQRKVQRCRKSWRVAGRSGEQSAFVILALSKRIALAMPNAALKRLSLRLASLYLCRAIFADKIEHDALFVEIDEIRRRWWVGVNYFSAQGDRRWWKDHRIPGGIAFSMNSVGHMALCQRVVKPYEEDSTGLLWALKVAMLLIDSTTPGVSGRNTQLLDLAAVSASLPCPFEQVPSKLEGKNYCIYEGQYHTDITVPSEYFTPDVTRPEALREYKDLDLTYLHHESPENPDYYKMGIGIAH